MNWIESDTPGRGNVSGKSVSGSDGCGYAQRSLAEAAAVLILTGQSGGGKLERGYFFGLANTRAAGMAGRHGVMMRGHVVGHFARRMGVPDLHDEHRGQGQLCPNHHHHEQGCRNGLLHHV